MFNLPNTLSLSRIVAAPLLLYLAWINRPRLFLFLLVGSLMTDVLDGFFARKRKQETGLGAKLDSWGDFATYMTLLICAWWLWPNLIRQEAPFVITVIASYTIPILFGFLKYRWLTSYHTWGAKFASALIIIGALLLVIFGMVWPFRTAAIVLALSAVEEMAITITLAKWQSNVPSVWHAIQFTRQQNTNPS
jgi:CDP-diacylglycerol--glycerol-3-phosphate 3-phosphatidyltransferase